VHGVEHDTEESTAGGCIDPAPDKRRDHEFDVAALRSTARHYQGVGLFRTRRNLIKSSLGLLYGRRHDRNGKYVHKQVDVMARNNCL
jgi:hypothetical protein